MANEDYKRIPGRGKFAYFGVDFHHPPDLMPPNRAPYLLNVTPNVLEGTLRARPGCTLLFDTHSGLPVHSLVRVNNSLPGAANAYARFVGSGPTLYAGQGSVVALESGYSGNPLSLVPFRPLQSPEPWLYVYDSLKQRKYKTDAATARNIGIAIPPAPGIVLDQPLYTILQDAAASGAWAGTGDAGAPSTTGRDPGGITAAVIVYDSGATGWAGVALTGSTTGYGWIGLGSRLDVDGESVTVEQVFVGTGATTVQAVVYDAGTTGHCFIQPVLSEQGLVRNQLVKIGSNYVRVLSVTAGPDGSYSFEANVSATVNPGDAITFVPGFRAWFASNHTAASTVTGTVNTSTLTFSTGVAQVALSGLTVDCTKAGTAPQRPLLAEDYMHVSFWTDKPQNIIEIHILLDVDAATNDFTRNYYYYVSRQGDFTQIVSGASATVPALLTSLTADIANSFDLSAESTDTGQSPYPVAPIAESGTPAGSAQLPPVQSWFEATFKLNDLIRVGSDKSVGLDNVKAIGIKVFLTASCGIKWGSWWAGGGYGPDANFNSYGNVGIPVQYRYRYRALETGAVSDVSPETRNGELPRRQRVLVSVTASADPQVSLIDIERFGGSNAVRGWKQVLTVPNTTAVYPDDIEEARAEGSESERGSTGSAETPSTRSGRAARSLSSTTRPTRFTRRRTAPCGLTWRRTWDWSAMSLSRSLKRRSPLRRCRTVGRAAATTG